jgi:RimJ/RimL family protein N-acetyltransferase
MISEFEFQPSLQNKWVRLEPLSLPDFEKLYAVASDPLLWEQHPNPDRYKKDVFTNFFTGAMESGGAFLVYDNETGAPIGSSRFYDLDKESSSVLIGYTFIARDHWGSGYNRALKSLMLNHSFRFVDTVIFHIGASNIRSQKSIERMGAEKIGQVEVAYFGEKEKLNFIYQIKKENWEG